MTDLERQMGELGTRAIGVWGAHAQLRLLQEECGELIVAVNHFERGRADELELADEIADVIIMCSQATSIVGVRAVREAISKKLARLHGRVEAAERNAEDAQLKRLGGER